MRDLESWLLGYLLNSLWQVPLLFGIAWITVRVLRRTGSVVQHRVWVSALLLQSLLPAISVSPLLALRAVLLWHSRAALPAKAHVTVVAGEGFGHSLLHLPAGLLLGVDVLYSLTLTYFIARFLWRTKNLAGIHRRSSLLHLKGDALQCWTRCSHRFDVHDAELAASSEIFGPITMGLHRKLILLPSGMLETLAINDLETVLAHEFAHLCRRDLPKHLAYELLAVPVSYHPFLWLTRGRLIESREMVCDELAAQLAGRKAYARSLLRLASLLVAEKPITIPHAIGIFDANAFERRIMQLIGLQNQIQGVRRVVTLAACIAVGVGACTSALALRMTVAAAAEKNPSAIATPAAPMRVPAGVMAGNLVARVNPKYPIPARNAKIQGTVVLHAIINKGGTIENLQIVSGPEELRQSSLDAVHQWTYKPFLLNGQPEEVETTINVTYTLTP